MKTRLSIRRNDQFSDQRTPIKASIRPSGAVVRGDLGAGVMPPSDQDASCLCRALVIARYEKPVACLAAWMAGPLAKRGSRIWLPTQPPGTPPNDPPMDAAIREIRRRICVGGVFPNDAA